MESNSLLVFSAVLPIVAGMILLLIGFVLSYNLEAFLQLFTHSDTPSFILEKKGVPAVKSYIKAVGTLSLVLGVGLIIYGFIVIGMTIF